VHFKPTKSLGPEHHEAHFVEGCDTCEMSEPLLSTCCSHGADMASGRSRLTRQHRVMDAQCDDGHAKVTSGSRHFVTV
jgi:hypothetical protein